jgi:hypothetical protein
MRDNLRIVVKEDAFMAKIFSTLACCFVMLVIALAVPGCHGGKGSSAVLTSPDGTRQITLPKGWKETRKLHEKADLQGADPANETYAFVLSEKKESFRDMTLRRYSDVTREAFAKTLANATMTGPKELTINGNAAIQYEIRGATQNLDIVYLHTIVETKRFYNQVMAWTLKSQWDKNERPLRDTVESFKEVESGADASDDAVN